ncbi:SRPBCC family protein [Streptomyces phaeoluteigriseus]|uniref:SRPBCC family protein n=1 Tax=Streptomyces phaeoluteigriseus TaxID=114686 RepID=UPI0036A4DB76
MARATTVAVSLAVAAVLGTTTAPAAESTPARTAQRDACRGQGVDGSALIRYESDIVIDAPLSTVWRLQTAVEHWPTWQAAVTGTERLDSGPLRRGSRFHWTTPAPATPTTPATTLGITSTVQQLQRGHCVLWRGPAVGDGLRIDEGVHLWTFTKAKGGGVHVHTEETWTGAQVEADVPTATAALGRGLETWLSDLETAAEARS